MNLEKAERLLSRNSVWEIRKRGITPRDCVILERWAINSPKSLQRLEKYGMERFLEILKEQSDVESLALAQFNGYPGAEYEFLDEKGIEMELPKIMAGKGL